MRKFLAKLDYEASFGWLNGKRPDGTEVGYPEKYDHAFLLGEFIETTEQVYWYMLECLPPLYMGYGGFMMSERSTGNITAAYFEVSRNGETRYFATHCRTTVLDFNAAYDEICKVMGL